MYVHYTYIFGNINIIIIHSLKHKYLYKYMSYAIINIAIAPLSLKNIERLRNILVTLLLQKMFINVFVFLNMSFK